MIQMENFKNIIYEERRRAGLTQEALATRVGITPQAISKWENGIGYPDVTLFPVIAEVLGIPISRLFGEEEKPAARKGTLPDTYGGLAFVLAAGEGVCYASKETEEVDAASGIVRFKDGSEVNLNTATVINRGAGEIRIYRLSELLPEVVWDEGRETVFEREFPFHPALVLTVSRGCDISVLAAEPGREGICRVSAVGTADFIAALSVTEEDERLVLEEKSRDGDGGSRRDGNRITVSVGADHANLLKCTLNAASNIKIEPDFDRMEVKINGCADLTANGVGEAILRVNGAGDIHLREIAVSADMHINGSGDITVERCASPKIQINGSGDVKCGEVHGAMSASVNGSGDITCGGDLAKLTLSVNGAGDFHGEALSVTDVEIKASQASADITIGHIRGTSVEKLGKHCTLTVNRRGI